MTPHVLAIGTTAFLASAVEMVEALTIVLAVGVTRGWVRALGAALLAIVVLAAITAIAGPRLPALVANHWVKLVVGALAFYVGQSWLRKAVLRASGHKAMRDESAAYARGVAELERESPTAAFATAFNGVLTEGIEVVAIVLALGSGTTDTLSAAAGGALVALAAVVAVGLLVHQPLSRVPENTMKYVVGVMVTAFGIFWIGEGLTIQWPASDAALFYLAAVVLGIAALATAALRRRPVKA
jgi:Ca2+/H+ antiporter, TMEM165/GDT1 family